MALDSGRDLVLLSLDGGGVRGLASLLILKRIMYVLDGRISPDVKRPLRPCDYFSMIAGTSTGGLIAIMLGVLRLDIDTCISVYLKSAPDIFPEERFLSGTRLMKFLKGAAGIARFDANVLTEKVREIISHGPDDLAPDALLNNENRDLESKCCRTFVCVTNKNTSTPSRLRNYHSAWEPSTGCKIWEAVRATSAAPLYFPPIQLGTPPTDYVDGGLTYNNPVRALFDEAKTVWGKSTQSIRCIISIGTGVPPLKATGDSGKQILENMVDIALNTQRIADEFAAEMDHLSEDKQIRYFRLNVLQGLQDVKLEEWKSFDLLTGATNYYLDTHKKDVESCVGAITGDYLANDSGAPTTDRFISGLPLSGHQFSGRATELERMHQILGPFAPQRRRLVLWGLAGHGKSRLLQHYVHLHESDFQAIIWINFSTTESAEESFWQASCEITARNPMWASAASTHRQNSMKLVLRWLSQPQNRNWFLVLDALDDPEAHNYRNLIPTSAHGSIAVTSMNSRMAQDLGFEGLEIGAMSPDDGIEMLLAGLHNSTLPQNALAKKVVKQLDGVPVAIEQARATIKRGIKLEEFLQLYESRYDEVMSQQLIWRDTDYDKNLSVTRMLDIILLKLRNDDDALNLLALESCMGPGLRPSYFTAAVVHDKDETAEFDELLQESNLPQAQWLNGFRKDILRSRIAASRLEEFCVLKLRYNAAGVPIKVSMDNCIRRWRLQRFTSEEKQVWVMLAAYVVGETLYLVPDRDHGPKKAGSNAISLVKHCQKMIDECVEKSSLEYPEGENSRFYAFLAPQFGHLLLAHGFTTEAESMLAAAIEYQTVVQGLTWPHDRESLMLLKDYYRALGKAGKLDEASKMLQKLHQSSMAIVGYYEELTVWSAAQLRDLHENKIANDNNQYRALLGANSSDPKTANRISSSQEEIHLRPDPSPISRTGGQRLLKNSQKGALKELADQMIDGTRKGSRLRYLQAVSAFSNTAISDEEFRLLQSFEGSAEKLGEGHPHTLHLKQELLGYYDDQKMSVQAEALRARRVYIRQATAEAEKVTLVEEILLLNPSLKLPEVTSKDFQRAIDEQFIRQAHGRLKTVCERLLCLGANINVRQNTSNKTAIFYASPETDLEFMELLLNEGLDVALRDESGQNCLESHISFWASKSPAFETRNAAKLMATHALGLGLVKDRWHLSARLAARTRDDDLLSRLLRKDNLSMLPEPTVILLFTCLVRNRRAVDSILNTLSSGTVLSNTAQRHNIESAIIISILLVGIYIIQPIVAKFEDLSLNFNCIRLGMSPLHAACIVNDIMVVDLLLSRNVELNALHPYTKEGALHVASARNYRQVVFRLIIAGADLDLEAGFGGSTAIEIAFKRGHMGIAYALARAGAKNNQAILDWIGSEEIEYILRYFKYHQFELKHQGEFELKPQGEDESKPPGEDESKHPGEDESKPPGENELKSPEKKRKRIADRLAKLTIGKQK